MNDMAITLENKDLQYNLIMGIEEDFYDILIIELTRWDLNIYEEVKILNNWKICSMFSVCAIWLILLLILWIDRLFLEMGSLMQKQVKILRTL